jgi:hypothetical protein
MAIQFGESDDLNRTYPAHPVPADADPDEVYDTMGLTKYEYFVAAAMQGLLANPNVGARGEPMELAILAHNYANAVLNFIAEV